MYITWSDRENVIRSGGFDILDNLPHFLLVLLIIQRFDLARWGFFTEFKGSPIHRERNCHQKFILEATFQNLDTIYIFPLEDSAYGGGINLLGRSTSVAGARKKINTDHPDQLTPEELRKGNNMIVKFSWPRKSRESEVKFIKEARKIGATNDLVKDHVPTILGHLDPTYITCSTRPIREFLGLKVDGERVLRVIVFRRLTEIKFLDEEHMLIAYLDCFFCEFLSLSLRHLMALTLWQVIGLCGRIASSTETSALGT